MFIYNKVLTSILVCVFLKNAAKVVFFYEIKVKKLTE